MTAQPVRVLHVCDKFGVAGSTIHGVSRLLTWWFPRFDRSLFDVRLTGLREEDAAARHLRGLGLDLECLGKGKFDLSTFGALKRRVLEQRPDILHLHGYGASNFGRMVAAVTGIPCILHEHAVFPKVPLYQVPFDRGLAYRTDRGLAVSAAVKDFMVRRRYLPEEKIEVLLNGAPLDEFKRLPAAQVEAERRRLGIPPGHRVVATVGRLDEQKGNRYFLEAAARLSRRPVGRDLTFLLVGDGPLLDEHREQAVALGIADRVVFTGYCSDVPRVQSVADIQAFPSLWEGVPLTLFEAMSMGLPIVSTGVDGLGEVLRDGENALVVPPRDADALAEAIETLLTDPARAARLAARAERDSDGYDVLRTVERLQEIYGQMAGQRRAAA